MEVVDGAELSQSWHRSRAWSTTPTTRGRRRSGAQCRRWSACAAWSVGTEGSERGRWRGALAGRPLRPGSVARAWARHPLRLGSVALGVARHPPALGRRFGCARRRM